MDKRTKLKRLPLQPLRLPLFIIKVWSRRFRYFAGGMMMAEKTRIEIIETDIERLKELGVPKDVTDRLERWLDGEKRKIDKEEIIFYGLA